MKRLRTAAAALVGITTNILLLSLSPPLLTVASSFSFDCHVLANTRSLSVSLVNYEKTSTLLSSSGCDDEGELQSLQRAPSAKIVSRKSEPNINERTIGILILLTVPLAWGTYTPVVKYLYEKMDPSMPGFVFSAGYYVVAAISLSVLSQLQAKSNEYNDIKEEDNKITYRGGLELGSYLFIGNGLQVIGLQSVPADRAAFLVQLTTVIVPLLSAFAAGNLLAIPPQTWAACIIAFSGVIIMSADGSGSGDNAGLFRPNSLEFNVSQGDVLVLLAAVAYSMHVVRLGLYAPKTTAIKLAASKATTEALLSIVLVVGLFYVGSSTQSSLPEFVNKIGSDVVGYYNAISSGITNGSVLSSESSLGASIAAILWTGWITCAYTIFGKFSLHRRYRFVLFFNAT